MPVVALNQDVTLVEKDLALIIPQATILTITVRARAVLFLFPLLQFLPCLC